MSQRPYKDFYVATTGTLLSSGTTTDLGVGQFGFFNSKTWQATTSPDGSIKQLVIAQGTPSMKGMPEGAGIPDVTFKVTVDAKGLINYYGKKSQRPKNMVVTLGFDGVDTSKTLSLKKGEVKQVYLKLSGQPISNFYPDVPAGLRVQFNLGDTCPADACTDDCDKLVDGNFLADQLIKQVNEFKIVGGQPLSKYVRATKLVSCQTPSGYPTVDYTSWTLTVCDDGSNTALATVQAQYPGVKISRKSRVGALSTYEAVILASEGAPADFENKAFAVVPNCDACPSGYTLQDTVYVYTAVKSGIQAASAASGASGYVSNSGVILGKAGENGFTTIQFYSTQSDLATVAASLSTFLVSAVGTHTGVCTLDEETTTPWTEGEACTKAQKKFQLSLKDNCDGTSALAELQAVYGSLGTVALVETNEAFCTSLFELTIESDNVLCPNCGDEFYQFTTPQSFGNQPWVPVVQDVTGEGCVYGVKFESAYFDLQRNECTFEVPYFNDPLYIEVGNHDHSSLGNPCATDWAVTTVQNVGFASGYGVFVSDLEKQSKYYRNIFYNIDPLVRRYRQFSWNTDFSGYYDEVVLVFQNTLPEYGINSAYRPEAFEVHFYLPEGNSTEFINALNSWVTSVSDLAPIAL